MAEIIITKVCETCNKVFIFKDSSPSHIKRSPPKFCSRSCIRNSSQFKKGVGTRTGTKQSEETKTKLSLVVRDRILKGKHNFKKGHTLGFKKGFTPWNKGKDFGGNEYLSKRISWLSLYRKWKLEIKTRDKFRCVICKDESPLNVDHYPKSLSELIKNFSIKNPQDTKKYKEFWDINNGRTLCVPCHKQTDTYGRNLR